MKIQLSALFILAVAATGWAAEVAPPSSERFAAADASETPDFQRHVVPLLGRLGCNSRACHGSFQGQGGFRLSLFGYDFASDHRGLTSETGGEGERRVKGNQPAASLILLKPTLQIDHEGGRRYAKDSWQYHVLLRWIEAGAKPVSGPARLVRLQIEPSAVLMQEPGQSQSLRVVAHWEDGTAEDVTCLCRFTSGDDSIAAVDADGQIKAMGRGDTHVVASYDNGVATVPIVIPVTDRVGPNYPEVAARTRIDELVVAKLKTLGVVPSEVCGDAEFLRRASIDLTGTLPTPEEIEAFLADGARDKRARKIDELLESPAYAAWWANRLCDITGNNPFRQSEGRIGHQLSVQWYSWIHRRVAENTPYDQIAAGIVLANGRRDGEQSYDEFAREMSSYLDESSDADFAARPTLPHYWTRRNVEKPDDKALAVAHSFLGLRLQCAQCHKHPHDRWTQGDFQQFTRFFAALEFGVPASAKGEFDRLARSTGQPTGGNNMGSVTQEAAALAGEGRTIAWRELYFNPARGPQGRLNLLGESVAASKDEDPRAALMAWMRRPDNPYFARAFVNRVWANYFHAGLIEPVDDLNLANPPSNRELLDYLAEGFVAAGFDMKWLHREITRSDTYQRSWRPNETNRDDRRNFSRAIPRRLPAEVVYDALKQSTAADAELVRVRENLDRRAIGHLATRMAGTYAQRVFGQPERLTACDCERSNTPSLLQSIFLQNDPLIHVRLDESGWLQDVAVAQSPDREALIRAAYLRTVSRPPDERELARARDYLNDGDSLEGLRDLLWALLNSKEFILNH